ncbi:DUF4873 domain-containing protein [Actinomycetospora cinnamomea]|uniref:Uncharacterized protein DUF4873 n=1 Tax=Actinomycetospora cinnamomea TaxID=663609 RepID=A0A2U1F6I2_9PSEU|nr:DUF4873 domain-containing protein [Actinomycetospora cinnamomea]PVZ07774.1 uncharacterized protein DUF4873 [Actinomycetospora cinnamomea]
MTPAAAPEHDGTRDQHDHDQHDHDEDGYRGAATLEVDGTSYAVDVVLVGHFEPLDGRYHWYGRVAAHAGLDAALGGAKRPARVTTPAGAADGELSDVDPWGRYRLAGVSTPPFEVESARDVAVEAV